MKQINIMDNKKTIWIFTAIGVLVIIVVAIATVIKLSKKPTDKVTNINVETKEIDPKELPEKFPKELPLEAGATVIVNNNISSDVGHFSGTRRFESKKSLSENFDLYKNFFEKNGWEILNTVDTENLKIINAKKDGTTTRVDINRNTVTNIITVDLTVTPEGGAK